MHTVKDLQRFQPSDHHLWNSVKPIWKLLTFPETVFPLQQKIAINLFLYRKIMHHVSPTIQH